MSGVRKQFDFSRFKRRYIALKILYFGWDYDGLSSQLNNENTIEFHLFQALKKTCLIESRDQCDYNRCGRTDKGVSSYGQVVNLTVRSNQTDETLPQNIGLFTPDAYTGQTTGSSSDVSQELDYVAILNRVLPEHVKIIAWAPVRKEFSSRFSCRSRSYSYIFPLGDLCISSMQKALSYLVGEHDFRNLCSFDLKNGVTNHKRTIVSAYIEPLKTITQISETTEDSDNHYLFYQIVIVGHAFLYHQIRCIMTIVFLVGTKKESPDVIRELLNVKNCPAQPNYNRASPMPLCLFDCKYDLDDMPQGWIHNLEAMFNLRKQLKRLWLQYKTKSMMIERFLLDMSSPIHCQIQGDEEPKQKKSRLEQETWKDFGLECDNMSDIKYVPLMKRPRGEPLETKLELLRKN